MPFFKTNYSPVIPMIIGLLLQASQAELTFKQVRQQMEASLSQETLNFVFEFKNTGHNTVKINELQANCSCITPRLEHQKTTYEPDESGKIEIAFALGGFTGESVKQVMVKCDDGERPEIELTLVAKVPAPFTLEPLALSWQLGEAPEAKIMILKNLQSEPLKVVSLTPTSKNVDCEIMAIKEGEEYQIKVKPKSTEKPSLGALTVLTDLPFKSYGRKTATYTVKGAAMSLRAKGKSPTK